MAAESTMSTVAAEPDLQADVDDGSVESTVSTPAAVTAEPDLQADVDDGSVESTVSTPAAVTAEPGLQADVDDGSVDSTVSTPAAVTAERALQEDVDDELTLKLMMVASNAESRVHTQALIDVKIQHLQHVTLLEWRAHVSSARQLAVAEKVLAEERRQHAARVAKLEADAAGLFAVADLVDLVYDKGDEDGIEMKNRLNEEASKHFAIQKAVADVRHNRSSAYAAARTLVPLCSTADEDASDSTWLNHVVKPFEQDAVEALIGEDRCGEIQAVCTAAGISLETLLNSGHPDCMEALEITQQSADAQGLADNVSAFQDQQEELQIVQQAKNNSYKLFKDPTVDVAIGDSLREYGEMKRVPLKSMDDLEDLRTSLDRMHLTADVNMNGIFIAKGAKLLTQDAYMVYGDEKTLKSFDLVLETAPEGPFWVMASFKESFSEALLHGDQTRLEAEYDKLDVGLAEELQAGVEHMSCKTWEAGTELMSQVQLVCLKIEEIKAIRDEFMPTACKHAEDARQFHQQLDTIQDIFTVALNNLTVRSEECEQVDTDAIFMVMEAQRENQEQLAAFLNTFEKNRCKLAQRNLLFCYKDALQQKQAWFQKKVDQSGLQSARSRVEELLTTTTTPSTLAADITQGLQDTAGCAASAFRSAQQKLDICLERSLSGRQQVLEAQQHELDGIEVELPPLEEAVKQGRKKMIALRTMQGERQMCEKRKESLEMQQAITRQLKGNLQVVADELPEIGDAAGDDIQNEADQLLPVFVAETPEPCATTTLSTCGPDLATVVAMEVAKQLAKEREKIFANGLKEGLKQAAAMNQDWIQCGEGEGA